MGSRRTIRRERARRRRGIRKGVPLGLGEVPEYVEIEMLLICKKCGKELDAEEHFYPRKGTKTGYQYECKTCRKKINEKYKKTKSAERPTRGKDKKDRKPRGTSWNHKEAHRKRIIREGGTKISAGESIADTSRTFNFALRLIIDQQMLLFFGRNIQTATGQVRMREVLDDLSFEVRDAISRASIRMRTVHKVDIANRQTGNGDIRLQKRRVALLALNLRESATLEEVKRAYKTLAMKAHPDHGGDARLMCRLNEALRVLTEEVNA